VDGVTNIYLFKDKYYWYDFSAEGLRDWWVDTALNMASNELIDGVFIDAIAKTPSETEAPLYVDGLPATDYMLMAEGLSQGMPPGKMLVGNALRNETSNGQRTHMTYLDGSYLERWYIPMSGTSQEDADAIAVSIQLMREALSKGKMINFQSGPPDGYDSTQEHMAEEVEFPLAIFLICAETNAFFSYQGGVNAADPSWLWDSSWIEELNRPLGAPLGDPVQNGTVYTRSYEYVDVWVDIHTGETQLTWRDKQTVLEIIGRDNFDGEDGYLSRTITDGINNANNLWGIVDRDTVVTDEVIDTSVAAGGVVALESTDTFGFLGTNKTDQVFGMYRAGGSRSLVYTFNIAGAEALKLGMDWACSGDISDKNTSVSCSIDGGATQTVFEVGTGSVNWSETLDDGTVLDRERNAAVLVNGVAAAHLTDEFQTYTPSVDGTGQVLTVTIVMDSTVGGFGGFGLDNLTLYDPTESDGFESWISGYSLSGTNALESADPDSDGYLNLQEYIAGLNPTHSDSFRISGYSMGLSNAVTWHAVSGRVYDVYWSSNLVDGFTLIQSNALEGTFIDTEYADKPAGFYKITVGLE
jgi:hypothetical protein